MFRNLERGFIRARGVGLLEEEAQVRKRLVTVAAAAAALALVVSGCTGKEQRANQNAGTGSWSAGTDTIQIGLVAPMTGAFAVLGVSQQNSMQIVVDQINTAGGIGGAKLEIVT